MDLTKQICKKMEAVIAKQSASADDQDKSLDQQLRETAILTGMTAMRIEVLKTIIEETRAEVERVPV